LQNHTDTSHDPRAIEHGALNRQTAAQRFGCIRASFLCAFLQRIVEECLGKVLHGSSTRELFAGVSAGNPQLLLSEQTS
jgi:hypothetical protein